MIKLGFIQQLRDSASLLTALLNHVSVRRDSTGLINMETGKRKRRLSCGIFWDGGGPTRLGLSALILASNPLINRQLQEILVWERLDGLFDATEGAVD